MTSEEHSAFDLLETTFTPEVGNVTRALQLLGIFPDVILTQVPSPMDVQFPLFLLEKDCGELCKFDSIAEIQHKLEN